MNIRYDEETGEVWGSDDGPYGGGGEIGHAKKVNGKWRYSGQRLSQYERMQLAECIAWRCWKELREMFESLKKSYRKRGK